MTHIDLELRSGMRRYTLEIIASGQPRPHADSVTHAKLYIEWAPYTNNQKQWEANDMHSAIVRRVAKGMLEFVDPDDKEYCWASSKLTRMTKIDKGVWEFVVTTPFTD